MLFLKHSFRWKSSTQCWYW